jgi:hypothetical protein
VTRILHDVAVSVNHDDAVGLACSAYPVTCRRADGLLTCAYRAGSAQHGPDGIGVVRTSTDHGRSWSAPVIVFDGRDCDPPESYATSQVLAPCDGSLLVLFCVVVCTHPDHDFLDTEEGYAQELRYYRARSVDDGRTWSSPEPITFSLPQPSLCGRSFVFPDGELFINTKHKTPDGRCAMAGCFSNDHGRTFSPIVEFVTDPDGVVVYDEAYYTTFDDGEVLVLIWTFKSDRDNPNVLRILETLPVHRSVSRDRGRTWSAPQPTNIIGQLTCPLAVDGRTVIAASNHRREPAGILLWTSHDRGTTFEPNPLQMWDAREERVVAAPVSSLVPCDVSDDHRMESFTFGLPDLNDLDDGTYMLTYYATIDGELHVRACRFSLSP